MLDLVGLIVGTVITLGIGSYLLSDNLFYRWTLALLVGAGVGYAFGIVLDYLWQWFFQGISTSPSLWGRLYYVIPILLGALILFKGFPRISHLGNVSMAVILGVGAATAVSGALLGTLLPQIEVTGKAVVSQGIVAGSITIVGTICSLLAFAPRAEIKDTWPHKILTGLQAIGRIFIVVSLGVVFAGMITSSLTLLVNRLWSFVDLIRVIATQAGGS